MRTLAAALALALVLTGATLASAQAPAAAAHATRGFEALKSGRAQEAAAAFDEALKLAPHEPVLLLGAGAAAHLQGRMDQARLFLVDALKRNPRLTEASLLLGDVLYRAGDLQTAITTYEQAQAYAPEDARLATRLESWRKELDLHGRFNSRIGAHFTVLFEGPAEADLAARAVEILERAYWRMGAALYAYPPDVITVVLYTREQFRDITQSPAWAGGSFDGRIRVPVRGALQNLTEFERVLAHEFTHALVRSLGSRHVPQWLDEGLASYYEGGDPGSSRALVKSAPALIPMTRLERSFADLDSRAARLAYAQSAVAVARLLEQAGPVEMVNLLTDLGAGVPFADAFARRMFMTYAEFQDKLLRER